MTTEEIQDVPMRDGRPDVGLSQKWVDHRAAILEDRAWQFAQFCERNDRARQGARLQAMALRARIRAQLRETVPNAVDLARFDMGDEIPTAGTLNYRGGPERGVKVSCYLNAGETELVALKAKKVTKVTAAGYAIGDTVLKVAWHGSLDQVLGFMPEGAK